MTIPRSLRVALSALVLAAAVAGCASSGGDDAAPPTTEETTTTTVVALSTAEFVDAAQAICVAGNLDLIAAAEPLDDHPTDAQVEEYLPDYLSTIGRMVDDIEALEPPVELSVDVDAFIASARDALDAIEDTGPSALTSGDDPFAEANQLANDLGLLECGSG